MTSTPRAQGLGVIGLWHLGCVTATCLAEAGFDVMAFDPQEETRRMIQDGQTPLFEPGLQELLKKGLASGRLKVADSRAQLVESHEILWVTFDTPVDEDDRADVEFVLNQVIECAKLATHPLHFLISSQIPAGSTRELERRLKSLNLKFEPRISVLPENLRLGQAIQVFTKPDRVLIGVRDQEAREQLTNFFAPFQWNIVWMSCESAEMSKHAINAFLATSVTFINELARLCAHTGANPFEVEQALKTDLRIGAKAYVKPGGPFRGGTLARDIQFLRQLGIQAGENMSLIAGVDQSNRAHSTWPIDTLNRLSLPKGKIALLGLTYKPGTDTLRRSYGLEVADQLTQLGYKVMAHDPMLIQKGRQETPTYTLVPTLEEALKEAQAALVCTPHEEFKTLTPEVALQIMKNAIVIDPQGHLAKTFKASANLRYLTLGA